MNNDNPAFTGFFNNDHKRIDLVLVVSDSGSDQKQELRINFFINAIKFGFELELEEGQMAEHKNLIFVKMHAPDSIIEEYGLYFNERNFFKDNHVEFIHPFLNPLGMTHERELIKIVRESYPGPVSYSTLERSKIVYQIFLWLPFGQHENQFGINRLIERNTILDAFALHDGPYFYAPGQSSAYINARQTLFYNWVGVVNIWRSQPIHMIREYLGVRVAFFFAYYEYFNIILLIPAIYGFWIVSHYYDDIIKTTRLDILMKEVCSTTVHKVICPQCRNFKLCPFREMASYCKELNFIHIIDRPEMKDFAIFISIWAIIFTVLWKRKESYLNWMWEVKRKYIKNKVRPDYWSNQKFNRSHLTGISLSKNSNIYLIYIVIKKGFLFLLTLAVFGAWLFGLFLLSTHVWYIKHWLQSEYDSRSLKNTQGLLRLLSYDREHLFIGIGAGVYSVLVTVLRRVGGKLAYILTAMENNKTIVSYERSVACKLYILFFTATFALLTLHIFVGRVFHTHILDMKNWYTIAGFGVMNNGFGTSLDDICITLAVAVLIEQIIARIPLYFDYKRTDYEAIINTNAPCWEREYKLETLNDYYFYNAYINIIIQFAMSTLFSLTFPLALMPILLINVWDIRHRARNLLLGYRRPLLLNASGPAVWHTLICVTAFIVPIFNAAIYTMHSRDFLMNNAIQYVGVPFPKLNYYQTDIKEFLSLTGDGSPAEEVKKLNNKVAYCTNIAQYHWFRNSTSKKFYLEAEAVMAQTYLTHSFFLFSASGIVINLLIYLLVPSESTDIEKTKVVERRIKQKYFVEKGFLPHNE